MNRRGLLAMVHCAKKDLCLDDETYRLVLEQVTGKRSAGDLDDAELGRVVERFRARGWSPRSKGGRKLSDKPHIRKVWALWGDLGRRGALRSPTTAALRAFVRRLTGVADPEWLTIEQATKVIESLKVWSNRTQKRGAS